ncbi:MAG: hypothetical protein J5711_02320 [Bacteroidales bacterium]|nr:hypothetical protein [Bacteroidales bacterium]
MYFKKYIDNVGWVFIKNFPEWDEHTVIQYRAAAYHRESPNSNQKNALKYWIDNIDKEIKLMNNALMHHFMTQHPEKGTSDFSDWKKHFSPTELLFFQNGNFALLGELSYSELGLAILHTSDGYIVGPQFIVSNHKINH